MNRGIDHASVEGANRGPDVPEQSRVTKTPRNAAPLSPTSPRENATASASASTAVVTGGTAVAAGAHEQPRVLLQGRQPAVGPHAHSRAGTASRRSGRRPAARGAIAPAQSGRAPRWSFTIQPAELGARALAHESPPARGRRPGAEAVRQVHVDRGAECVALPAHVAHEADAVREEDVVPHWFSDVVNSRDAGPEQREPVALRERRGRLGERAVSPVSDAAPPPAGNCRAGKPPLTRSAARAGPSAAARRRES